MREKLSRCMLLIRDTSEQFYHLKVKNSIFVLFSCFRLLKYVERVCVIGKPIPDFLTTAHWSNFDISTAFLLNGQNIPKNVRVTLALNQGQGHVTPQQFYTKSNKTNWPFNRAKSEGCMANKWQMQRETLRPQGLRLICVTHTPIYIQTCYIMMALSRSPTIEWQASRNCSGWLQYTSIFFYLFLPSDMALKYST